KVFYALRPTATLRWLRVRPGDVVPPMDLAALLAESCVVRAASALVARKAVTRETGSGPVPGPLAAFVDDELARAFAVAAAPAAGRAAAREEAARFFRAAVARYGAAVPRAGAARGALTPARGAGR